MTTIVVIISDETIESGPLITKKVNGKPVESAMPKSGQSVEFTLELGESLEVHELSDQPIKG